MTLMSEASKPLFAEGVKSLSGRQ